MQVPRYIYDPAFHYPHGRWYESIIRKDLNGELRYIHDKVRHILIEGPRWKHYSLFPEFRPVLVRVLINVAGRYKSLLESTVSLYIIRPRLVFIMCPGPVMHKLIQLLAARPLVTAHVVAQSEKVALVERQTDVFNRLASYHLLNQGVVEISGRTYE